MDIVKMRTQNKLMLESGTLTNMDTNGLMEDKIISKISDQTSANCAMIEQHVEM